jgi:hypothetical protein
VLGHRVSGDDGSVGPVGYLAALELRRRWAKWLALAMVVGIVSAVVLTLVAGARRTGTSLDRFKATARSADVELAVDGVLTPDELARLEALPQVSGLAVLRGFGLSVIPQLSSVSVPVDASYGTTIDRGRLLRGRDVDPTTHDEVVLGEALATQLQLDVGGVLRAGSYSPEQIAAALAGAETDLGPLAGPEVRLRVVGITRRPLDLSERVTSSGFLVLSPGFAAAYEGRVGEWGTYVRIRTTDGADDVPAVVAAAREVLGDRLFANQNLAVEYQGAHAAVHVNSVTLWIVAGVAAVAGAATVAFVLGREVELLDRNGPALRALGVTEAQRIEVAAALVSLAAIVGAVVAVGAAVLASPLLPIGIARRAEPGHGVHADWLVLGLGAGAIVIVVLAPVMVVARRAARRTATGAIRSGRPSRLVGRAASLGLPPTAVTGLRMAVERQRSVPVRTGYAGAVVAVLGASGALVFAANLQHLVGSPPLFGTNWEFLVEDRYATTSCGSSDEFGLLEVAEIASLTEVCYQNIEVGGRPVAAISYASRRGPAVEPAVLEGHPPRTAGEIAVGSDTLEALGKRIGDTVEATGRYQTRTYTVVGRVTMPTYGQAQPVADGAVMTAEGFAPLYDPYLFFRYFVGTYAAGADRASLAAELIRIGEVTSPVGPVVPVEIERVRQVDWSPVVLGVLLGVMGAGSVTHSLATTVRRRRAEFAVLKTIGFTSGQVRSVVAWQATTLAVVGVVIGVPAGLLVGNASWRAVAGSIGVAPNVVLTAWVLAPVVGVVVVANLVATAPARAAARTRPALALRSE